MTKNDGFRYSSIFIFGFDSSRYAYPTVYWMRVSNPTLDRHPEKKKLNTVTLHEPHVRTSRRASEEELRSVTKTPLTEKKVVEPVVGTQKLQDLSFRAIPTVTKSVHARDVENEDVEDDHACRCT